MHGRGARATFIATVTHERDLRVHAAVADGQALLVGEDDAVAFLVAGADEDGVDHADAHAADAGHVGAPGGAGLGHLVDAHRLRELVQGHVRQHVAAAALADDRHLLEARAGLDVGAGLVAGAHALAGAVVHAPGQVRVDLSAVVGLYRGQARAGRRLGALQAVLADLLRDVHVRLARKVAVLLDGLALLLHDAAVVGDAALLVGDHDLDAVGEDRLLQHGAVGAALLGADLHDRQRAGAGHAADDVLDVLDVRAVAQHVHLGAGVLLVAGHRGGLVLQDDEGDVLASLDRVADGDGSAVEEGAVAHEHDLLVGDERVDAGTRPRAEAHAAVVVHELLGRREHEHRVAAGVAVGDEVDGADAVVQAHVLGVGEVLAQFEQRCGRIAVRAAGAEGRRARHNLLDGQHVQLGLADLLDDVQLGGEPAVAQLGRDLLGGLDQRDQDLREDRGVQAARLGDGVQGPAVGGGREGLAVESAGQRGGFFDG
jgi:hypothetical protein